MAYKIVTCLLHEGRQIGYRSLVRRGTGEVLYKVGEPTKPQPNCGPLAAFKTLKDVNLFKRANGWRDCPVFRCRVKKETEEATLFIKRGSDNEFSLPWYLAFRGPLPQGTVLCKEITLTKRIR